MFQVSGRDWNSDNISLKKKKWNFIISCFSPIKKTVPSIKQQRADGIFFLLKIAPWFRHVLLPECTQSILIPVIKRHHWKWWKTKRRSIRTIVHINTKSMQMIPRLRQRRARLKISWSFLFPRRPSKLQELSDDEKLNFCSSCWAHKVKNRNLVLLAKRWNLFT